VIRIDSPDIDSCAKATSPRDLAIDRTAHRGEYHEQTLPRVQRDWRNSTSHGEVSRVLHARGYYQSMGTSPLFTRTE